MTRIPEPLKDAPQVIDQAWAFDQGQQMEGEETYRYQRFALCHYGMAQRWLVVYSQAAWQRGEKTGAKAQAKEQKRVDKQGFHLPA